MNILIMTNTYKPLVGGLEKSVELFSEEFRRRGHRVMIITPECEGMRPEQDVIRIPAVQKFNGSDFSVQLPIPGVLKEALGDFKPDIVHSQHPFLIGDTALRVAHAFNVPLVFTHHTLYEQNLQYVPGNEEGMKKFVIELSTGYANLADQVFAPSPSVAQLIRDRGVESPIDVVPTGIWIDQFYRGAGKAFRKKHKIPSDAFVVGHLGRLSVEKNLDFLSETVMRFLKENEKACFLVVGKGPYEEKIKETALKHGANDRLFLAGSLQGRDKVDAYYAMDVFAFASQSETQGLVLTEALACKVPVVAVDASGVREVVEDKINGRLIMQQDEEEFIKALHWVKNLPEVSRKRIKKSCRYTVEQFSMDKSASKALEIYVSLSVRHGFVRRETEDSSWHKTIRFLQAQGGLIKNLTKAAGALVSSSLNHGESHESL